MALAHLDIQLHQQDTDDTCGSAVVQMVLGAAKAPMPSQNELWHQLSDSQWNAAPSKVADYLSGVQELHQPFGRCSDADADVAAARIAYTIKTGVAVPAVVFCCGHWVLVIGFIPALNPGTQSMVVLNNPFPQTASISHPSGSTKTPPLPHNPGDACGTAPEKWYGYQNEHQTWAGWKAHYWPSPCQQEPCEQGTYITVCPAESMPPMPPPLPVRVKMRRAKDKVGSRSARKAAKREIVEHGLDRQGPLAEYLRHAKPTSAALVRQLGTHGDSYYLVLTRRHGHSTGMVTVDARHATFLGVIAGTQVHELPPRGRHAVRNALERQAGTLRDLFPGEPSEYRLAIKELVWRPCRESQSPFYPFREIEYGGTTLYLACDGRIHRELHTDIRA